MTKLNFLSRLWSPREDRQSNEVRVTSYGASDEHPMSTRSASDGIRWKQSGKLHSVVRCAAMFVMLFTIGSGNAWGDTWTWTASGGGNLGTSNGSVTLNGKTWSVNRSSWAQSGTMNNGCYQCGSKSNPSTLTLSTSAFSTYTITQIDVVCSSYGGNHNIAMTVGASSFLAATATASGDGSAAANKSGSGSASGDITISFTQKSSSWRAMYIKSITITYSAAASKTLSSIAITTQPTTRKYLVGETFSKTGAVVTATYSDATTANVSTSATWTPTGALTAGTSKTVTASYTEGGVTKTATTTIDVYSVTVQKKDEDGTTIADAGVTASASGRTLTASAGSTHYVFKTWKYGTASGTSIASATSASTSLTGTPSAAVTVIAEFYKPCTVTWSVSGNTSTISATTNVTHGTTVSMPTPSIPVDCTGSTFMGWTTSANASYSGDSAPSPLYNGTSPAITGDITFYAVFADED